MLEGVWLSKPQYYKILVPLVANQIVYLLLSTDSHDAHNERNLVRLIIILPNLKENYYHHWGDVCDAISRKYQGESESKGISISKPTLKRWATALGDDIGE